MCVYIYRYIAITSILQPPDPRYDAPPSASNCSDGTQDAWRSALLKGLRFKQFEGGERPLCGLGFKL